MCKDTTIFSELQEFFLQNDAHLAINRISDVMNSLRLHKNKIGIEKAENCQFTTDTELDFFKAYEIYAMRWSIEVSFAEMKGLLNLGKCQVRNFTEQIASISLCILQYNILGYVKRFNSY